MCYNEVSTDTQKKPLISLSFGPLKKIISCNPKSQMKNMITYELCNFFSCIVLVYYNADTTNIKSWIRP